MTLTDKKRAMGTLLVGGLVLVIIWLLLRSMGIAPLQSVQHAINVVLGQPDEVTNDFGDINLGSIYLNPPEKTTGGCGCGCEGPDGSNYFKSVYEGAANAYSDNLNKLQQLVGDAYLATLPSQVKQYLGQDAAYNQYAESLQTIFAV